MVQGGCMVPGVHGPRGWCMVLGGVWSQGGACPRGVHGPGGCMVLGGGGIPACTEAEPPPPDEQNDKQV